MTPRTRPFRFERGAAHFSELALWLDAHDSRAADEWAVVSHAHSDHIARHKRVILTEPTARLLRQRLGGQREERVLRFGERAEFSGPRGDFALTLLPAGHILGSAMVLVEWSGGSLLYTGDFRLRSSDACEPCDFTVARGCDWLVMETTFGRPEYVFPPTAEIVECLLRFCREGLAAGETPVLLGWTLGKAQELLCLLADTGLRVAVHEAVLPLARIYEQCGQRFGDYEMLDASTEKDRVFICPPTFAQSPQRAALGPCRLAVATGWAMDSSCKYRSGVDAAFPLSDHADFKELIELVRQVRPRRIFTTHGFAADFAATLRDLGFDAEALVAAEQLTLSLGVAPTQIESPATVSRKGREGREED
ncbi:MAG: MBL fold metallo-hydrolase RNA specificity domain-containing protein [Limisphaerales bacterium]